MPLYGSASYGCTVTITTTSALSVTYAVSGDWGSAMLDGIINSSDAGSLLQASRNLAVAPTTVHLSGFVRQPDGGPLVGANVDIGNEYLLTSIAVVVIGGTSVAGGKANVPGIWGAAMFLVMLLTMLNTFGVSAGLRLLLTGLIIVGVITAAGGKTSFGDHPP
jgi:ABC-type glucose/galactose transport system permease subunit